MLVEATVCKDVSPAVAPVGTLVIRDKHVCAAHGIELMVAIFKRLADVPAFPERNRQQPLAVVAHDRLGDRSAKADVRRLRPDRRFCVGIITTDVPVTAASVEMRARLLEE